MGGGKRARFIGWFCRQYKAGADVCTDYQRRENLQRGEFSARGCFFVRPRDARIACNGVGGIGFRAVFVFADAGGKPEFELIQYRFYRLVRGLAADGFCGCGYKTDIKKLSPRTTAWMQEVEQRMEQLPSPRRTRSFISSGLCGE